MGYRLRVNPKGNVSKEVFFNKMTELKYMFPTWKMDLSNKDVMSLLYKHLGYCVDEVFAKGIDEYIKTETFSPTVAGLQKYVKSLDMRYPKIRKVDLRKGYELAYVFERGPTILIDRDAVYIGPEYEKKDSYCIVVGDIIEDISTLDGIIEIHNERQYISSTKNTKRIEAKKQVGEY